MERMRNIDMPNQQADCDEWMKALWGSLWVLHFPKPGPKYGETYHQNLGDLFLDLDARKIHLFAVDPHSAPRGIEVGCAPELFYWRVIHASACARWLDAPASPRCHVWLPEEGYGIGGLLVQYEPGTLLGSTGKTIRHHCLAIQGLVGHSCFEEFWSAHGREGSLA